MPVSIHVGAALRQDELLEFALVFKDEERHLHLGYDPAVFDVDAHELPDTVEAVVQRVLVDEQLLACFGGMGGVLQIDEQRVGEIRSMLQILFDHMHERRVAQGEQGFLVFDMRNHVRHAVVGEEVDRPFAVVGHAA